MALILNIDTALDIASISLSDNEEVLHLAINENQKDHAAWLHTAIRDALQKTGQEWKNIGAIAVSIGPGSYTGLRVSLSAAKGFCYALDIPLITVGTLAVMAHAVKEEATELIGPLIDARRMEVFSAFYDKQMMEITKPSAMIITENSFHELIDKHKICFCGTGSKKLQKMLPLHMNISFSETRATAANLGIIASAYFKQEQFSSLAYTEPLYIKDFYSPFRKTS